MIRATNTIKHLDVKTRLFEVREGRDPVLRKKKKKGVHVPEGSRQRGGSTPVLCWKPKFIVYAFMHASALSCEVGRVCVVIQQSSV